MKKEFLEPNCLKAVLGNPQIGHSSGDFSTLLFDLINYITEIRREEYQSKLFLEIGNSFLFLKFRKNRICIFPSFILDFVKY